MWAGVIGKLFHLQELIGNQKSHCCEKEWLVSIIQIESTCELRERLEWIVGCKGSYYNSKWWEMTFNYSSIMRIIIDWLSASSYWELKNSLRSFDFISKILGQESLTYCYFWKLLGIHRNINIYEIQFVFKTQLIWNDIL